MWGRKRRPGPEAARNDAGSSEKPRTAGNAAKPGEQYELYRPSPERQAQEKAERAARQQGREQAEGSREDRVMANVDAYTRGENVVRVFEACHSTQDLVARLDRMRGLGASLKSGEQVLDVPRLARSIGRALSEANKKHEAHQRVELKRARLAAKKRGRGKEGCGNPV